MIEMNIMDLIGLCIIIYETIIIYCKLSYNGDMDKFKNEIHREQMRDILKKIYPHFKW